MRIITHIATVDGCTRAELVTTFFTNPTTEGQRVRALLLAKPLLDRIIFLRFACHAGKDNELADVRDANLAAWFHQGCAARAVAWSSWFTSFWTALRGASPPYCIPHRILLDHETYMSTFRFNRADENPTPAHVALAPFWSDPVALAQMTPEVAALDPASFNPTHPSYRNNVTTFTLWASARDQQWVRSTTIDTYTAVYGTRPGLFNYNNQTLPSSGVKGHNGWTEPSLPYNDIASPDLYPVQSDSNEPGVLGAVGWQLNRLASIQDPQIIPWILPFGYIASDGNYVNWSEERYVHARIRKALSDRDITEVCLFVNPYIPEMVTQAPLAAAFYSERVPRFRSKPRVIPSSR